jgi:hypothetical protein
MPWCLRGCNDAIVSCLLSVVCFIRCMTCRVLYVVFWILDLRMSDLSDWRSSQDMDASPACDVYAVQEVLV